MPHDQQSIEQAKTRLSARRTYPSRRSHQRDCGEMSSSLGTAGLVAWPCSWPRWAVRYRCRAWATLHESVELPRANWRCSSRGSACVFRAAPWAGHRGARLPAPIKPKTRAMPTNNGVRLHDRQRIANLWKQPIETNEYQVVEDAERESLRSSPPQNVNLLPQCPNLCLERCPRPK